MCRKVKFNKDYIVTTNGDLYRERNGNITKRKPMLQSCGYHQYMLCNKNKKKTVYIHRLMVETFKTEEMFPNCRIDHIDRDRTNNNIDNLRVCSASQNARNAKKYLSGSSKYKGVSYRKDRGTWGCSIYRDGKRKRIGGFETQEEAAKAYDKMAILLDGEFACTNETLGLYKGAKNE